MRTVVKSFFRSAPLLLLGSLFALSAGCAAETPDSIPESVGDGLEVEDVGEASEALSTCSCYCPTDTDPCPCANGPCSTAEIGPLSTRWRLHSFDSLHPGETDPPDDVRYASCTPGDGFDFNWGLGSPAACIHPESFAVRLLRKFPSGYYKFTPSVPGGAEGDVALFLDGSEIPDEDWDCLQIPSTKTGYQKVRVNYWHHTGNAGVSLQVEEFSDPNCQNPI